MEFLAFILLSPVVLLFAVLTAVLRQRRLLRGRGLLAPIGLFASVVLLIAGVQFGRGVFDSAGDVFTHEFGFAPQTPDVQDLEGEYRHLGATDHAELSFVASPRVVDRIRHDPRWSMVDPDGLGPVHPSERVRLQAEGCKDGTRLSLATEAWLQPPRPGPGGAACTAILCSDSSGRVAFASWCGY